MLGFDVETMVAGREVFWQGEESFSAPSACILALQRFQDVFLLFPGLQSEVEVYGCFCSDLENRFRRFIPPDYSNRWDKDRIQLQFPLSESSWNVSIRMKRGTQTSKDGCDGFGRGTTSISQTIVEGGCQPIESSEFMELVCFTALHST